MNTFLLTAALAVSIGAPTIVIAQSMPAPPAGTVACRPAKSGETGNATMGTASLVCHKVNVARVMAAEKTLMSMMKSKMTPDEMKHMHAASMAMSEELMLPDTYSQFIPGTNGSPNS
jgi:hypothetical protein